MEKGESNSNDVHDDLQQLKASAADIGRQLKSSGKIIAKRVSIEAKKAQEEISQRAPGEIEKGRDKAQAAFSKLREAGKGSAHLQKPARKPIQKSTKKPIQPLILLLIALCAAPLAISLGFSSCSSEQSSESETAIEVSGSAERDSGDESKDKKEKKPSAAVEPSYSSETAQRVATVAMTNMYADDVFADDGSGYDTAKFHSYADMSAYYITVVENGTWKIVNESTWHVDNMRFKVAGNEMRIQLTADVHYDGTRYAVTNGSAAYANSFEDIENDSSTVGIDELNAKDSTPYLYVDENLISEDRDMEAEAAAASAEANAKAAADEYENWVGSQFSLWDGKNKQLVKLVKSSLNDERSFEHIETNYITCDTEDSLATVNDALSADELPLANEKDVYVVMDFSAKNAFNATIKQQAHGIIRYPSGDVELLAVI